MTELIRRLGLGRLLEVQTVVVAALLYPELLARAVVVWEKLP